MTLLLLTGLCGMIVGAGGWPPTWLVAVTMLGLALACGGASALNHVLDRDIDREMTADVRPPGRGRTRSRRVRARVRPCALGPVLRPPRELRQRADRSARARRQPLLRPRLHPLAEALDAAEHRHRRRSRCGAAAGRVGSRDRRPHGAGVVPVPDRLLLDPAALLGARASDPARLRGGADPDAPGRARRACHDAADRRSTRWCSCRSHSCRSSGTRSASSTSWPRSRSAPALLWLAVALARRTTPARARLLFHFSLAYLALLFVAMATRPVGGMTEHDSELERKNTMLGWALFGVFVRCSSAPSWSRSSTCSSTESRASSGRAPLAGPPSSSPLRAYR